MGYIDAGHAYSKTRLGLNRSDDPSFTSRTPYSPYEMHNFESTFIPLQQMSVLRMSFQDSK